MLHGFHRTAGRIGAREPGILLQPCIGVAGKRVDFLTGSGDLLNCLCEIPCHESFTGFVAEDFFPGAALVGDSCRNLLCECFAGSRAVITVCSQKTDLIFNLDHDDGILFGVCLADMAHQLREGSSILLNSRCAERGDGSHRLAGDLLCTEISLRIFLYPRRSIERFCVLPQAKPQEDQLQAFLTCLRDQRIDR